MAARLLGSLPAPLSIVPDDVAPEADAAPAAAGMAGPPRRAPPYGRRQGFVPRKPEDFADGGAFPEIHVAQYPLDLGRKPGAGAGAGAAGAGAAGVGIGTGPAATQRSATLPVTVNADGSVDYSALVRQGANASKQIVAHHSALVPKLAGEADGEEADEHAAVEATAARTAAALERLVSAKIAVAQPKQLPPKPKEPEYIKYTPSQQGAAFNSGASQRVIRMVEQQVDPLEPPKFRFKRVPRGPGSPPVPVLHSPPRAVTVQDQADWKIPPCISNWKNAKGYTIPLDKRLAADGRGLQEVQINDNFAKLAESLFVAESKARESVEMRGKIQRELLAKEKEKKEAELRAIAQRARMERAGGGGGAMGAAPAGAVPPGPPPLPPGGLPPSARYAGGGGGRDDYGGRDEHEGGRDAGGADRDDGRYPPAPPPAGETAEEREARLRRDEIREERRRERERERRLEAAEVHGGKKSKLTRDRDRDVSERIALGQATAGRGGGGGSEAMYDQRLFNQDAGMAAGFASEDAYNLYDKPLFADKGSNLYAPKPVDGDTYGGGGAGEPDDALRTDRFKADRGFQGAEPSGKGGGGGGGAGPRTGPVEFERDAAGDDPFGLGQFLTEVNRGKKAVGSIGGGGSMAAAGGGAGSRDGYDGGSGRSRVDFERGRG